MDLISEITYLDGVICHSDFPLRQKTSYKSGGKCKYYISVNSLRALQNVVEIVSSKNIPFFILGGGTNLLVSDDGYSGAVIDVCHLNDIFLSGGKVKAMSGARLSSLYNFALIHSMSGLERLSMIPGTLGGAIFMNASAFNGSISDIIYSVETLACGKIKKYYRGDCKFGYRKSVFQSNGEIILSAVLALKPGDKEDIIRSKEKFDAYRMNTQPKGNTFGSVFKNPYGYSAAKLIEGVNLKGFSIGGARVSEKHANFIINEDNGSSSDVYKLINIIKTAVQEKYGITLKEEVKYLGNFNDT